MYRCVAGCMGEWMRPASPFTYYTYKYQTQKALSCTILATAVIRVCHCLHLQDIENSMKMWEYKHIEIQAASQPQLDSQESQGSLSDEECAQMQHLAQLAENLISR